MISFLSLILIILIYIKSFLKLRKKISLYWEIKRGILCYSCKEIVSDDEYQYINVIDKEDLKLCKSCDRDEKIGSIIDKSYSRKYLNKFKKYLVSDKNNKIIFIYIVLIFLSLIIDFILNLGLGLNIRMFLVLSPILNILYALIFYYKIKITSGQDKNIIE